MKALLFIFLVTALAFQQGASYVGLRHDGASFPAGRANLRTGKIEEASVGGVRCRNQGHGL